MSRRIATYLTPTSRSEQSPLHKETTMTNRRAFCRTVAGAAGALVLAPPFHAARAQEARRQVTIGGRRVKVIDIHCHCVIPEAAEVVKNTPLAKAGGGGGNKGPGAHSPGLQGKV